MMNKTIIQGIILVASFFATLFVLRQIDWMTVFKVQKVTEKTEKKLGNLYWEIFEKTERENKNPYVIKSIDSLVKQICTKNKVDFKRLKIHILDTDEINAFALPNGHLIINKGLILATENQDELSGVICHEIAHIELDHVMKKLIKEVGLSVLISMTTGKNSGESIKETAKMLSSTAFDRSLEREADIKAVEYLIKAQINPESLANFLYKLATTENSATKYLTWISTHPDTKERAGFILEYASNKLVIKQPILAKETWDKLKKELK